MDNNKKRVGVFPSGSEIALEIHSALKYSTFLEVYGLTSISNHSKYVFKNCIENIPMITDECFFDKFNEIIVQNNIDYIFPALDDAQLFLLRNREKIKAEIISPCLETVEICRSKKKTYKFFESEKFIPKTFDCVEDIKDYPVFIKPDVGQGSQGAKLVKNCEELDFELSKGVDYVICENLPGQEFTIDCFTDNNREILVCKMRNRKRIRNGISVSSEILKMPKEVLEIAKIINEKILFKGVWFFQLKKDDKGEFRLLEIAARVAGTMGITRNTGNNLPLMTMFLFMGYPIKTIGNNYNIEVDRALVSRFETSIDYNVVYVDLDDTIIINKFVNTIIVGFLYQVKNARKRIILITKHLIDPRETLKKNHIDIKLFDEIIWLKEGDDKSLYINETEAIFIDDSFTERLNISIKKQIPVFDCSEVEALIDYKM